jgi:ATP-dependent Lhr-like helicase
MLSQLDPLIAEWFSARLGAPTEPQRLGWPEIHAGHDVLISAPTGSGKTLAAFLMAIDRLARDARAGTLANETYVVYVSPLKALSNDVQKNLDAPLAEISALAASKGIPFAPIRTALRTGDTPAWERQQFGKMPPHILVTTPESLYIMLTAARPREILRTTRTIIVDEVHAVVDDKRGSHLALTLARLEALAHSRPQRIGLSATVNPVEEVAPYLSDRAHIVNVGHRRDMDLSIEIPKDELSAVASNEMWAEIYDRLATLINENRTTLVFVNTRRLSERVAHHLEERVGKELVIAHHGSLSRRTRLEAEARLKAGELRAVVATASLELGIDIGSVDLACQIGSPRSIAVALQRFGRSGHWVGARPKGVLFATTRDELVECTALLDAIRAGKLDRLELCGAALDILAQQIVAAAANDEWGEDDLYALARSAYPYRDLARSDFDDVLTMLSDGISTSRGRTGAYLHRDRVNHRVRGRRGARLAAITSGGAIPETANYNVILEPEGTTIGTLHEDFAVESLAGDVFLLGTHAWRIKRVEPGRVRVVDAAGAAPSFPFWLGEAPGRTAELSQEISDLRARIVDDAAESVDRQAVAYVKAGAAALGALPSVDTVVAERFFDESGGMQLVIHAPFGARINRAWGLALRKRFCRSFNLELQAAATDNGIVISLTEQHAFPIDIIFEFLKPETVEPVLTQAMLPSPMFTARWRWNCARALAILRFRGGAKVPANIQRMRADDLMAAVFPDQAACAENLTGEIRIPDHPLVKETIDNCLYEAMDLHGLKRVLAGIRSGEIRTVAIDTAEPSPFSHEILNANPYAYLDDAPLEERRTLAVQMRRSLPQEVAGGPGALDAAAIAQVAAESWPLVRDEHELHDALLTLVALPPVAEWQHWFEELVKARRASLWQGFWVTAERLETAIAAHEGDEEAAASILRGWFESTCPLTADGLAEKLALRRDLVDIALARLEGEGQILRGQFTPGSTAVEWCHRRLLARIHRMTIGRLRREIEPVTTTDFMRFLARWQHVAPGTQLHGLDGMLQIVKQLQGYEISAAAWESEILPRRIADYEPELLDQVCLSGEAMWGRLSRHPAFESDDQERRRVRPTRVAPISIFLRQDAEWLLDASALLSEESLSHPAREILRQLIERGASFFNDLVRGTGRLPSEVEDGLWELVAAGLVTADGFENLRSLVDPKRRRGEGRGRTARPRHAAGRWALLPRPPEGVPSTEAYVRQLLERWGVVFRDLMARETLAPAWRDLLPVLRRMEARGEIRGGRFTAGFIGEQFALPEALDLLRAVRRSPGSDGIEVAATDPLNLAGIILPGARVSALSGETVSLVPRAALVLAG